MCVRERGREARPRRDAGQLLEQVSGCVCALSPDRKVKSIMMTKSRRKAAVNHGGAESNTKCQLTQRTCNKKDVTDGAKRGRAGKYEMHEVDRKDATVADRQLWRWEMRRPKLTSTLVRVVQP